VDSVYKNWFPWQCPLRGRKNNFRSFIYSQGSTNRANFVKIGLVNLDTIGLTEITKNFKSISKTSVLPDCASRSAGGLINEFVVFVNLLGIGTGTAGNGNRYLSFDRIRRKN